MIPEIQRDMMAPRPSRGALSLQGLAEDPHVDRDRFEAVSGQQPALNNPACGLAPLFLAFSVATVPIELYNPRNELQRSGVVSALQALRPRLGKRITLSEARSLALQIYANAESRLREERVAEAELFLSFDEDDFRPINR